LIAELRACEKRIAKLNDEHQFRNGPRPSEADPDVCQRRKVLRHMLITKDYTP
jgi:hypothetical protein